jgi:hypothetical protein
VEIEVLSFYRNVVIFAVVGLVLVLSSPQPVMAQGAGGDGGVTLAVLEQNALEQDATDADIQKFVTAALAEYQDNEAGLADLVRRLVEVSPKLTDAFLQVGTSGTTGQKTAIGTGLGEAASVINKTDAEAATAIGQLVADSGDKVIQAAFTAAVGGGTAAVPGAPAGGGATGAAGDQAGPGGGTPAPSLAVGSSGGGSGGGSISPSS